MRSLSSSDPGRWRDALERVRALAAAGDHRAGESPDAPDDERQRVLAALLGEVARLYTARAVEPYGDTAREAIAVGPTEACTVAAALLSSQSITPFEFSIWYAGGRVTARGTRRPDEPVSRPE